MKKINKDNCIKIIILCGLEIFFGKLIITGEITNYVHPRIILFVYFLIIGFLIMILHMFKQCLYNLNFKIEVRKYEVFILTLIFILYMNFSNINVLDVSRENSAYSTEKSADLAVKADKNTNNEDIKSESNTDNNSNKNQDGLNEKKLNEIDNIIVIERSNFVSSLDEIINRPNEYEGREISISGFVYRNEYVNKDEFILGRYMMVCCAADMQIAGIICTGGNCESLKSNTWVKVKGKVTIDRDEPIINIDKAEVDENPDKQYVYPFD